MASSTSSTSSTPATPAKASTPAKGKGTKRGTPAKKGAAPVKKGTFYVLTGGGAGVTLTAEGGAKRNVTLLRVEVVSAPANGTVKVRDSKGTVYTAKVSEVQASVKVGAWKKGQHAPVKRTPAKKGTPAKGAKRTPAKGASKAA